MKNKTKDVKKAVAGPQATLPPVKVFGTGKDYNRAAGKAALRKEVTHVA